MPARRLTKLPLNSIRPSDQKFFVRLYPSCFPFPPIFVYSISLSSSPFSFIASLMPPFSSLYSLSGFIHSTCILHLYSLILPRSLLQFSFFAFSFSFYFLSSFSLSTSPYIPLILSSSFHLLSNFLNTTVIPSLTQRTN